MKEIVEIIIFLRKFCRLCSIQFLLICLNRPYFCVSVTQKKKTKHGFSVLTDKNAHVTTKIEFYLKIRFIYFILLFISFRSFYVILLILHWYMWAHPNIFLHVCVFFTQKKNTEFEKWIAVLSEVNRWFAQNVVFFSFFNWNCKPKTNGKDQHFSALLLHGCHFFYFFIHIFYACICQCQCCLVVCV